MHIDSNNKLLISVVDSLTCDVSFAWNAKLMLARPDVVVYNI